jgi:hypothetical protein
LRDQIVDAGLDLHSCFFNSTESEYEVVYNTTTYSYEEYNPWTNTTYTYNYNYTYVTGVKEGEKYYSKVVDYIAYADNNVQYKDETGHGSKIAGMHWLRRGPSVAQE